jgi:hypothetical protein
MFNPLKKLLSIPASRLARLEATRSMGSAMPRVAPLLSQVASKVPDLPLPDLPTIGGKSLGAGLPTGLTNLGAGLITDIRNMPGGRNYPGLISDIGGYRPGGLGGDLPLRSLGLNSPEIPETSRFDNVAEDVVGLIPLTFD